MQNFVKGRGLSALGRWTQSLRKPVTDGINEMSSDLAKVPGIGQSNLKELPLLISGGGVMYASLCILMTYKKLSKTSLAETHIALDIFFF